MDRGDVIHRTVAEEQIRKEFERARAAREAGNEGMVRVCARRAAGAALGFWLHGNPRPRWGQDAVSRLRSAVASQELPQAEREAAERLIARVTQEFTSPYRTDPLDDARQVIGFFLGTPLFP